jgi:hypothetical protein
MAEASYKRRLTTVFSADVVGYSRLMGEDKVEPFPTPPCHMQNTVIIQRPISILSSHMSHRMYTSTRLRPFGEVLSG